MQGTWIDRSVLLKRIGFAVLGIALMIPAAVIIYVFGTAMVNLAGEHKWLELLGALLIWSAGIGLGYGGWRLFEKRK